MKEKIRININTFNNTVKGPCFRISCDNELLVECLDYQKESYEGVFELELSEGSHKIVIEHFGKHPRDTVGDLDVATQVTDISFNGIKCDHVDLHENYFYTTDWPYKIEDKIKNNLYFGFNGKYEYEFRSPATSYVLEQKRKYQKKNLKDVEDFTINEDEFIKKLEDYIKLESH